MITWRQVLPVWWSTAWRGAIYGLIGGMVLGAIGGVIAAVMQTPAKAVLYGTAGGYIAAIPSSIFALKQALSKHLSAMAKIAAAPSL